MVINKTLTCIKVDRYATKQHQFGVAVVVAKPVGRLLLLIVRVEGNQFNCRFNAANGDCDIHDNNHVFPIWKGYCSPCCNKLGI